MKSKKLFLVLSFLLINVASFSQQISSSFVVGGAIDKFYPVTFYDAGWDENIPTELTIGRSNVHTDETWRGSLIANFKFHTTNWGHGSSFIKVEIAKSTSGYNTSFIAGWDDASSSNGSKRIVVWMRGGGTTYYCKSTHTVIPVVYDSSAFNEENGPSRTFKTSVEDYVVSVSNLTIGGANSSSIIGQNIFPANGNAGIATITPYDKLEVNGNVFAHAYNAIGSLTRYHSTGGLALVGNAGSLFANIQAYSDASGTGKNLALNPSSGFVGIGTTTPAGLLDVNGSVFLKGNQMLSNDGASSYFHSNAATYFENMGTVSATIAANGDFGIGTTDPKNKLSVNGTIWAKEVKVSLVDAADWVFDKKYKLKPLDEVEKYIIKNKHLPDVPSADEFRQNDMNVSEMSNKLLQKIEELTLYAIAQQKELDRLKTENENFKSLAERLSALEKELKK